MYANDKTKQVYVQIDEQKIPVVKPSRSQIAQPSGGDGALPLHWS